MIKAEQLQTQMAKTAYSQASKSSASSPTKTPRNGEQYKQMAISSPPTEGKTSRINRRKL